ncbi:MAG: hypothetical protein RL040_1274 [Bacteroidota bacterium]|jgi:uncharacterized protein YyaL (SSP411 family)
MNRLAQETSPYLLQHKDNPVHWFSWCEEAWEKARNENKLVLVSIGYSACHWCHVMEHEVFEDYECAEFMNMHFVCIKVDREERPDVDSWHMDAVHLMGSQGGWPLNVFTLPDGRPIYGGTYFPKQRWMELLENLHHVMKDDAARATEYASQLQAALIELNSGTKSGGVMADLNQVHGWITNWTKYWDAELGGNRKAPKFPMPSNWELLLQYAVYFNSEEAIKQTRNTLHKMAMGGIYDQLAGGFARYSVDAEWKVPHFEKMLYDNAQLVALYAQAYRAFGDDLYAQVVDDTLAFIQREWKGPSGLYYAALDADSDGVEGKYYVWTEAELEALLGTDSTLIKKYLGVGTHGYWEHDVSVLCVKDEVEKWCREQSTELNEWNAILKRCKSILFQHREKRTKPSLDDKCIASWNAMLIRAFAEASKMKSRSFFVEQAVDLAECMIQHLMQPNGLLAHAHTKGRITEVILLEDQVFFIDAMLSLYEITGMEKWLKRAAKMMDAVDVVFSKNDVAFFQNRSVEAEDVTGVKFEINDNVIPAGNSVACRCLLKLGRLLEEKKYVNRAHNMLNQVSESIDFAPGFSNWIIALLELVSEPVELVFTGPQALNNSKTFQEKLHPFVLVSASTTDSELPLFRGRGGESSAIYVCKNQSCGMPVYSTDDIRI